MKRSLSFSSDDALVLNTQSSTAVSPNLWWDQCDGQLAIFTSATQQIVLASLRGILKVTSLKVAEDNDGGRIGEFLRKCFFCKKNLLSSSEVFMYGNLGAFCSPECRARQITVDKVMENILEQSKGRGSECTRTKKRRGSQPENCEASKFHI